MKARSISGATVKEIETALQHSLAAGFSPTVGFIFISVKMDRRALCDLLVAHAIDIVGATSSGEFIDGYQEEGTAVILLMDLPRDAYRVNFCDLTGRVMAQASTDFAMEAKAAFNKPGFILCSTAFDKSGEILDGETLVRSIEQVMGEQVNIFGGMAGDDLTFGGSFVFTQDRETDNGVIALVIDEDKVMLQGMAISGWKPIGITRTITRSIGNIIYTIDDQPALEMYLKFLGTESGSAEDKFHIFDSTGIHYPFQVERPAGVPVMRTPMSVIREENAVVCDFDVPQGSGISFSMPPDFDIVEKVLDDAKELRDRSGSDAEALLVFSCASRLASLGPLVKAENEGLHEIWNAPMAGFFTYGEYGRAIEGRQEFHSTTCCWVALKEKQ